MTESPQDLRDAIPLEETQLDPPTEEKSTSTGIKILLGILAVVIIGLVITGLVFLVQPGTDTGRVRDIFIIFMALEFLVIGLALIILIIQLARLTLLLQNEIKPILDSTNRTANTLRGTSEFLSDHLVEPVLKLNEYLAGLNRIIDLVKPLKK